MKCNRCKKEITAKMDKFTFAEQTVCANCFDALWEEAGEAEMREDAERAELEARSKLEAGW